MGYRRGASFGYGGLAIAAAMANIGTVAYGKVEKKSEPLSNTDPDCEEVKKLTRQQRRYRDRMIAKGRITE